MNRTVGASIEARKVPTARWQVAHPGEEPPDEEAEVAIMIVGLEVRQPVVLLANGRDKPEQRGIPLREVARIPWAAWTQAMNAAFGEPG